MKRQALLIPLLMLAAIDPVRVQSWPDPSGTYRCEGVGTDGRTYLAAVQIVRNGETYLVRWLTPGGVINLGVGVMTAGTLAVGYVGASAGVIVYEIDKEQRLTGHWADLTTSGHVYKETLTRLGEGEKIALPLTGPTF